MGSVGQLVMNIFQSLPLWASVLIGSALAIAIGPAWWRSRREKYVRALVRQATRQRGERQEALFQKMFAVAKGEARYLEAILIEADKRHLPPLRQRAQLALEQAKGGDAILARYRANTTRAASSDASAFEAAITIRAMWDEGEHIRASQRLNEAIARWPHDPDLRALTALIDGPVVDDASERG